MNSLTDKSDLLRQMFLLQEEFMQGLRRVKGENEMPAWPLDMTVKSNQVFLKGIAYESMGELFEAVKELKNSKKHRQTEISDFSRDDFLEEMVDAMRYFLEILIYTGVTPDELMKAFQQKDEVLHQRLKQGY